MTEHVCLYRFTVKWGDVGYHISLSSGCAKHCFHPKLRAEDLPYPSRLTEAHEKEIMDSIRAANVNNGAGRMVFQERVGYVIDRNKFRYMTRRNQIVKEALAWST